MDTEHAKTAGDVAAGIVGFATLFEWLPAVAAALTIVWTALRIYEWAINRRWRKV